MKQFKYILLVGLVLMFASCSRDNSTDAGQESQLKEVLIMGSISRSVSGTNWQEGDKIGVFMKKYGTALAAEEPLVDNNLYTYSSSYFSGKSMYYPANGVPIDLVGYYPYQAAFENSLYTYKVNVANQSNPAAIDLLYSNNVVGRTWTLSPVNLSFKHQLSRIVLTVKKGTGVVEDLSSVTVSLGGMPTTADFSLSSGLFENVGTIADIVPRTVAAGVSYEAIIIPQGTGVEWRTINISLPGMPTFTYTIPVEHDFLSGNSYPYTITVNKTGIVVSQGDVRDWYEGYRESGIAYAAKVGDYYYSDGSISDTYESSATNPCIGIVFREKTPGQSGLIVSLDTSSKTWSMEDTAINATNTGDGAINMDVVASLQLSKYPAFEWCASKNVSGGVSWYLPSINELQALYNAKASIATALANAGGAAIGSVVHWSSTQYPIQSNAYTIQFNTNYTGYSLKINPRQVRAVAAF